MGSYLYFSSLLDFMRFRRLVPWILLGFLGMLLAIAWPYLNRESTPVDQYTSICSFLVFHVLALSSAIFSTAIVGQEVEQKTIIYLLTRPVARWKLLVSRYLASSTAVAFLAILGAIFVSAGVYHGGLFGNAVLMRDMVALTVGAFAYGALFLFVSLLLNRAMLICLLIAFGWETVIPNLPGEMYRLSINSYLSAIADHPSSLTAGNEVNAAAGALNTNTITSSTAYLVLFVMVAILLAVGSLWFTQGEYVPREDAG